MRKSTGAFARLPVLLGAVGVAIAVLSLTIWVLVVQAKALGPPYVVLVRDLNVSPGQAKVAVDAIHGYTYVRYADSVHIFQGTELVTSLQLGSLKGVFTDPPRGYAYLTRGSDPIIVLSGTTQLAPSISLGSAVGTMAVLTTTGHAYVTLPQDNAVAVLSGTQEITPRIAVGLNPAVVAVDPATDIVYVANAGDHTVSAIQGNAVQSTVDVVFTPTTLAVHPDANRLYVAHKEDDLVSVLQGGTIMGTVPVTSPGNLVADPRTGWMYVLASTGDPVDRYGWIVILEGTNHVATIPLGENLEPNAAALNPVSGYAYVAAGRGGEYGAVVTISGTRAIEYFAMGQTPWDVAVDPVLDFAYVPVHNAKVIVFGRGEVAYSPPVDATSPPASFVCTGTHDLPVLVQLPTGAIPTDAGTVEILCSPLLEADTSPTYVWAGQAFRIAAYRDGIHLPGFQFARPVTLTVSYDPAFLGSASEDNLELRARAGGIAVQEWVDEGLTFVARNSAHRVVTTTITLPADHALVGLYFELYLPLVMRQG